MSRSNHRCVHRCTLRRMAETTVTTRQFRQELAQYLARAAAGEAVTVTRHGRPDVIVVSAQDAPPLNDRNDG